MQEVQLIVQHPAGLHMRPAALFVQTAARFSSNIQVCNITRETDYQNAKSTIGVMLIRVKQGQTISIRAEGDDEENAITQLKALIENGFSAS